MRVAASLVPIVVLACSTPEPKEPPPLGDGPLYAVMFEVYDDTGSNSYLSLIDSLDLEALDPATSIEFAGGRAFLATYGGFLYVGEPATPIVRRYSVEGGELVEEGSVSFANFGLESGAIDPWSLNFVSDAKAYLFDWREGTQIVWNPTTMEIMGEIPPPPGFVVPEGWSIETSPAAIRGDRMYRSWYAADYATATYPPEHALAVYDTTTDELVGYVPETRCPAPGNLTHQDEAGNIYFSNWIWPIAGEVMRDAPASCVLRIPPGSDTFDPSWTFSYDALSGHPGAMFTYAGDGEALVAIFDETQVTVGPDTDPWALAGSPVWTIWDVDLDAVTGAPIDGIPPNSGAYTPVTFGDRRFLLVPSDGWAQTDLYELTEDGAVQGMDIPGWSYAFVQVR